MPPALQGVDEDPVLGGERLKFWHLLQFLHSAE